MIVVAGARPCKDSAGELDDPWIPMKGTWYPRPDGQPAYLRVSGGDGGDLELKLDPDSGAMIQFVVIGAPRDVDAADQRGAAVEVIDDVVPVLDLGDLKSGGSGTTVNLTIGMTAERARGSYAVRLGGALPVRKYRCGDLVVGVTADSELCELRVTRSAP